MAVLASETTGRATRAVRVASLLAIAAAGCGGGQGIGLLCQTSVASYCAQAGNCPRNWTEAQDVALLCQHGATWSIPVCAGYRELIVHGIDSGVRYFYDPQTGALVAVVGYAVPGGVNCLGGAGTFIVPSCDEAGGGPLACPSS